MITENYKEFRASLIDGQEYTTLIMPMEAFNGLDFEMQELIYQSGIRQENRKFDTDETHRELMKARAKINKEIVDYEFKINHK